MDVKGSTTRNMAAMRELAQHLLTVEEVRPRFPAVRLLHMQRRGSIYTADLQ